MRHSYKNKIKSGFSPKPVCNMLLEFQLHFPLSNAITFCITQHSQALNVPAFRVGTWDPSHIPTLAFSF